MKFFSVYWLGFLVLLICCISPGCYLPPRFLVYNNTEETIKISSGNSIFELQNHDKTKIVVYGSSGRSVTIQTTIKTWLYLFPVVKKEMHDDNLIIRVQVEKTGLLYILHPHTKIPANIGESDCILMVLTPIESQNFSAENNGTKANFVTKQP